MRTITWNMQVEPGASNPTFKAKSIFAAFKRIERYWDVRFQQVTSNPYFRILLTRHQPYPTWAAWTSGRTVNVGRFQFSSEDQATFVITHELGHVFGGSSHAPSGNVMAASIEDVYRNFTTVDSRWYYLPMKPNYIRPWQEPYHWRPLVKLPGVDADGLNYSKLVYSNGEQPCEVGHGSWRDWLRGFWKFPVVQVADE